MTATRYLRFCCNCPTLILHHVRPDAVLFTNLNVPLYFILPVLSRLSSNSSMKTGKSTPKEKANPIVRIIHNVEQKQRNHDQMLSCLTDETSPQHEVIFWEVLESIRRKWHLHSVLNVDQENPSFHRRPEPSTKTLARFSFCRFQ